MGSGAEKIRRILNENPVILAPMAGITDKTFRALVREQGGGFAYTEMISAKALTYANQKTKAMLDISGEQESVAIQLFGSEPDIMARAALMAGEAGAAFIDINMGCPMAKVVKNGEGSALLDKPALAAEIVSAMAKACDAPVSVKIRLGESADRIVTPGFALRMQEAGASLVAVHARTRDQYYGGKADWERIGLIKRALSIPVIGNGDIWSPEDALRMTRETGCDAVMVGRACLGNPWLPGRITRFLRGMIRGQDAGVSAEDTSGDERSADISARGATVDARNADADERGAEKPPDAAARINMALEHCRRLIAIKGEKKAIPEARKHFAWYLKGLPGTAALKGKLFHCVKYDEAFELLRDYAVTVHGVSERHNCRSVDYARR